ncbi:MAG TPA: SRPBCC family protein [Gammaproteobacteria bacterium]|jgi:uncharacterized protein YndB with AHSA1/START domain
MKNTNTVAVAASPARVFKLLNDSESLKQWIPNLIEDEVTERTDAGVGMRFRQVYLQNGRKMPMEGEVIAYRKDKYLACEIRGDSFDLIVDYSLEPQGDGTLLTQNSEILFRSTPMKIMSVLVKPLIRKAMNKQEVEQFSKLKALAEA